MFRAKSALLALTLFVAPAFAATTKTALKVHASPSAKSAVIFTIPAFTNVSVTSCNASWCSITWNGASGWAARRLLSLAPTQGQGRGYINSQGQHIPSPQFSPNGPPKGATAQCRDQTYSFSRSRSGTCSHHGGVARWL